MPFIIVFCLHALIGKCDAFKKKKKWKKDILTSQGVYQILFN